MVINSGGIRYSKSGLHLNTSHMPSDYIHSWNDSASRVFHQYIIVVEYLMYCNCSWVSPKSYKPSMTVKCRRLHSIVLSLLPCPYAHLEGKYTLFMIVLKCHFQGAKASHLSWKTFLSVEGQRCVMGHVKSLKQWVIGMSTEEYISFSVMPLSRATHSILVFFSPFV